MLRSLFYDFYAFLFSRIYFYKLNRALHHASLRGLGVLNYKNDMVSGERRFVKWRLSSLEAPTVVDVGANVGNYSLMVLESSSNAKVYAFEPHPETFKRLTARLASANNFIGTNAACGAAPEKLLLFDHEGGSGTGHASLLPGVIERMHGDKSDRHEVYVTTLDLFAAEHGISHIDLLKIDTEGTELDVLKGASNLLREGRISAIQFEFNEMNIVSRVFLRDFHELIPNCRFYRLLRHGLGPLDPYSPLACEVFAFQNIVALPTGPN